MKSKKSNVTIPVEPEAPVEAAPALPTVPVFQHDQVFTTPASELEELMYNQDMKTIGNSMRSLWEKLQCQISSYTRTNSDMAISICNQLPQLKMAGRQQLILNTWGPAILAKCVPLLRQIELLELSIAQIQPIV